MSIGVVLDTSALLAHLRLERVSGGELIGEVNEHGDLVGVPALAVADSLPKLGGEELFRLQRMLGWDDSGIAVLPFTGEDVMSLYAAMGVTGGGQGTAHAVVEAGRHGCLLATVRPEDIGSGLDPDDVIVLS